jgi:hypothetical protein
VPLGAADRAVDEVSDLQLADQVGDQAPAALLGGHAAGPGEGLHAEHGVHPGQCVPHRSGVVEIAAHQDRPQSRECLRSGLVGIPDEGVDAPAPLEQVPGGGSTLLARSAPRQ